MKTKSGFLPILPVLTVGLVLAIAVLVAVVIGGAALLTWVLSMNMFRLIGGLMIILALLSFTKWGLFPIPHKIVLIVLIIGAGLILLTFLSDVFNMPLAVLIP